MTKEGSFWLAVERLENWNIDAGEGFKRFGLSERRSRIASELRADDTVFVYVSSRISAIADCRRVTQDGHVRLGRDGEYDTAYEIAVKTAPLITLPRERWVPLGPLVTSLDFLRGSGDWRQSMRSALRRLTAEDGNLLLTEMRSRAK